MSRRSSGPPSRGPRQPKIITDQRGNLLIGFALILALVLVGALLLFTTGPIAQGPSSASNPAQSADALEQGVSGALNTSGGNESQRQLSDRAERAVDNAVAQHPAFDGLSTEQRRGVQRSLAQFVLLEAGDGSVTTIRPNLPASRNGTSIRSERPTTQSVDGGLRVTAADYPRGTLAIATNDTRAETFTVVRQSLPDAGRPLRIVAAGPETTWTARVYARGGSVHVETPGDRVTVTQDIVRIDFANGTVAGQQADIQFARGVDGPFDVRLESVGDTVGAFGLLAEGTPDDVVGTATPIRTSQGYFDAAFTVTTAEATGDAQFSTVIRLHPTQAIATGYERIEANQPPAVDFYYQPTSPGVDEDIRFVGQATDPDGEIVAYEWTYFGQGQPVGDRNTSTRVDRRSYLSAQEYSVQLTVRDDSGATATVTKTISVGSDGGGGGGGGGSGPTARISGPSTATVGQTVTFDGSNSEGLIQNYLQTARESRPSREGRVFRPVGTED